MIYTLTHHLHGDLCFKTTSCHPHVLVHQPVCPHALIKAHAAPQHPPVSEAKPWPSRQQVLTACASSPPSDTCCSSSVQLGWNTGFSSKFAVGQVLGRGSFGTVHKAVHKLTGNTYAVKVLKKASTYGDMQLDAINREVSTWRQAQGSKFVARLEGLYEDDQHAYIVQELCAGGDLKSLLEANGCVTESEAATIMRGVLDMLVECHSNRICYGDLKPANIMFSLAEEEQPTSPRGPKLQVRAVDFGSSRPYVKGGLKQQCGSPLYMAPEVIQGRYGVNADVWSAGVMLYQMLTGRLPLWKDKTIEEVAQLDRFTLLADIRCREVHIPRDGLSKDVKDLLLGMLDANAGTRLTAEQCLLHPWFQKTLGYTPAPSGRASNNVVDFPHHVGSPRAVPLSPSSGHHGAGVLSPSRSSTAVPRRTLSGELPACNLVPELLRAQAPVMVPAAE